MSQILIEVHLIFPSILTFDFSSHFTIQIVGPQIETMNHRPKVLQS